MSSESRLPRQAINEIVTTIEQTKPKTLVYCSADNVPALESLAEHGSTVVHVRDALELQVLPRFELGLVFDFLEPLPSNEGIQLLGRLRNFHCEQIWLAVTTSEHWHFNTLIGLGFKRSQCYSHDNREVCTYHYDIASYNRKREWNNSRYWANPENWGKYHW